jgi:hypothetical protein
LQLLVHGGAHLFQLGRVVLLDRRQAGLQGGADLAKALFVVRGQRREALIEQLTEVLERERGLLAGLAGIVREPLA